MINAILVIIIYLASISSSTFECSGGTCSFVRIIAAVILLLRLVIKTNKGKEMIKIVKDKLPKKIEKVFVNLVSCVAIAIMFLLGFSADMPTAKAGVLNFDDQITEIEDLANDGKTDKAIKKLEKLTEKYGSSDRILKEQVLVYLAAGNFEEADNALYSIKNQTSTDYYFLKEEYMLSNIDKTLENTGYILEFYIDGAKKHPDWSYAQKQAGIAENYRENYASAEYYLRRAYDLDPTDPVTLYNLGVAIAEQGYEQGRYDEALEFFDEAVTCGADEETQSHIAWYLDKILGEEE